MKHFSFLSVMALVCVVALSACTGSDVKKLLVGDTDKYGNTPKTAVEALYNTLLNQGNIIRLKEAVKFKENDKLSDYQKNFFFDKLRNSKATVKATKARTHDDYTLVTFTITHKDGTTEQRKHRVVKEDNVWKVIIGFSEIQSNI